MTSRHFKPTLWLRWMGSATFVGGGLAFLVEGWSDEHPVRRALSWAVASVSLTILGVTAQRRFRDPLGARLFLALAAATIPVHFSLVGAAAWSSVHEQMSRREALWVGTIAAVLLPVLSFGISALSRRRRHLVAGLLVALSMPLALPGRNGDVAAALVAAEAVVILAVELWVWRRDTAMHTAEAAVARALLLAPPTILLVRNLYYPITDAWVSAAVAAPSLALVALPRVSSLRGRTARWMQLTGTLGLGFAAMILLRKTDVLPLAWSLAALVGAEALVDASEGLAWLSALAFACAVAAAFIGRPDILATVLLVPAGTLHALAAYRRRAAERMVVVSAMTVVGFCGQCARLVRWPRHDLWMLSVGVGAALLIIASIVESRQPKIERAWASLRKHFAADDGEGDADGDE